MRAAFVLGNSTRADERLVARSARSGGFEVVVAGFRGEGGRAGGEWEGVGGSLAAGLRLITRRGGKHEAWREA